MSPRTHRARPRAEALEGRSLLSHAAPRLAHSSSPPPHQSVVIQAPDTVFASDTTQINVTLTRSATSPALLRRPLSYPFVGNYDDSLDPPPLPHGVEKAAPSIRPNFKKSITFRPGETTKTISLPIPVVPAGSPDYDIHMGEFEPYGLGYALFPDRIVKVYASPDRIPPTIVGKRLTPQGLAFTFSKPMNPATVQDVKNYEVTIISPGVWSSDRSVALSAAVYDPATQTVILIPTLPPGNNSYAVFIKRIADNTSITTLTDLEGNPYLNYGGVDVVPN